jgi:hypothetical protein
MLHWRESGRKNTVSSDNPRLPKVPQIPAVDYYELHIVCFNWQYGAGRKIGAREFKPPDMIVFKNRLIPWIERHNSVAEAEECENKYNVFHFLSPANACAQSFFEPRRGSKNTLQCVVRLFLF